MYFRRPLNKIIKIRSAFGQMKFCKYSHTSYYSRKSVLLKCIELRNTKSPLPLSTFSRNFTVGKSKENESKSRKSSSKLDLMAPSFRTNYSSLKFTSKNRKAMGEGIQIMPQKSLTLKMCRQPSYNLSTFQSIGGGTESHSSSEGKTEKKEEVVETTTKTDFCRHICGPCSSKVSLETSVLKPPSDRKAPERILERLTDAEIKEICETRCPCRESSVPCAPQSAKTQTTADDLEKNLEKPPTATQLTLKLQDSSSGKIEGSTNYFGTIFSPKKFRSTIRRNRKKRLTNNQPSTINGSRQTNPIGHTRRGQEVSFNQSSAAKNPLQPTRIRPSSKLSSKYARMIRSKQTNSLPTPLMPQYRIHPRQALRISPRQTCGTQLHQANPIDFRPTHRIDTRQTYHIGPLPAPYDRRRQQDSVSRAPPSMQIHLEPKTNPCAPFGGSSCHYGPFKPVPLRYIPIHPQNYQHHPVVENRLPRFNPMHVRMPHHPVNSLQWHEWQKNAANSPVFGNESGRNRQMVNVQPRMPTIITNPPELIADSINNAKVDSHKGTGAALPLSDLVTATNKNKISEHLRQKKAQPTDLAGDDIQTLQQCRGIMSKTIENQTVVVDGPGKLKFATSPYPEMRDEKDVIIQMEYVNLTDADARHYSTGKYNPYSYATTIVGRTGSGIIIETGQNVHDLKPGDKVFVKPTTCGKCALCLSDHRNLCEYVTASELSPMVGLLSRLHVHSSEFVTKIPQNVSVLNGAMTWTLSAAIRGCQKASVSAGDVVLVIGGGPLGMATSLAAQLLGATTVCLADIRKPILDDAETLGIEEVFRIDPRSPSQNTAIKLWEQIKVYPRVAFDCTGSQLSNEIAINATQTGGKVVVMTNSRTDIPLPISDLVTRDIDVIISTCGNDESDTAALRFLSTKKIPFENYLHKHYDLSNAIEAFEDLHGPNRSDSHIIVKCGCACGKRVSSEDKKKS